MVGETPIDERRRKTWLSADAGDFENFRAQVEVTTKGEDWPLAQSIERNVPIYSGKDIRKKADLSDERANLLAEWATVFETGPGIIVINDALPDHNVIDKATDVFDAIIEREKDAGAGGADHFAKPGANDRVWNALQKHCLASPENFARYYASDAIALAAEAWLGRGYQMTAQVNRVNPGGQAQMPHRDYHLGFMTPDQMLRYPAQIHKVSPLLTLQGAVAHVDMPLESGPTVYLPYSQMFYEGYLAFSRPEYQAYFAENHVQLPLEKGDAVFFNPALMHGAGNNTSKDIRRMANLLQVSSPFGRMMEAVDRHAMVKALYPVLAAGHFSDREKANAIAACAEGYAFPTNLDHLPPQGGLAPKTQAEHMAAALAENMSAEEWITFADDYEAKRQP